jgi:hypothetical protein
VADAALVGAPAPQQILLTRKGTQALVHVEHLLDDASRALSSQAGPAGTLGALDGDHRDGTLTAATEFKPAGTSRGD